MSSPQSPLRFERLPAVKARTGMSRSWIYAAMDDGRFPKAVKIGGATAWRASDVDAWIDALCAAPARRDVPHRRGH